MDLDIKQNVLKAGRRRKRRRAAAIISGICATILTIFIIIALNLFYVDRFTVTIEEGTALYLTTREDDSMQVTTLRADPLMQSTNIQYTDIPEDIDEGLGKKNLDKNYFAYSFYLGTPEEEKVDYVMTMHLKEATKDLEEAIKVMIIKDGVRTIYSAPDENGEPKPLYDGIPGDYTTKEVIGETTPFETGRYIITQAYDLLPEERTKYTVVMWIDGWESVNSMKGGTFSADLKFSTNI